MAPCVCAPWQKLLTLLLIIIKYFQGFYLNSSLTLKIQQQDYFPNIPVFVQTLKNTMKM